MQTNSSRLDALAMTAWWSAAARAYESHRGDRLFSDSWAMDLVGPAGFNRFRRAVSENGAGTEDLQAVITRFFDDFLLEMTQTYAVRQVVLVAAGLDTRAFRLRWPAQTRLFELDQPGVIAYKDQKLSEIGVTAGCERHALGVDLSNPWSEVLCRAGFDPSQRSVWLLEGFLYLLAPPVVSELFSRIADLAAPKSWLGLDVVNDEMLTSPTTRHWIERMSLAGVPWLFTVSEPEALLAEYGWSARAVQPGEKGADFGRCPYPLTSRSTSGVPRSFLVTARRQ